MTRAAPAGPTAATGATTAATTGASTAASTSACYNASSTDATAAGWLRRARPLLGTLV